MEPSAFFCCGTTIWSSSSRYSRVTRLWLPSPSAKRRVVETRPLCDWRPSAGRRLQYRGGVLPSLVPSLAPSLALPTALATRPESLTPVAHAYLIVIVGSRSQ